MLDRSTKEIPGGTIVGREGRGFKNLPDSLETDNVVLDIGVGAEQVKGHIKRLCNGRNGFGKAVKDILRSFEEACPVVGQRSDILWWSGRAGS
jgi:hypothetical protein